MTTAATSYTSEQLREMYSSVSSEQLHRRIDMLAEHLRRDAVEIRVLRAELTRRSLQTATDDEPTGAPGTEHDEAPRPVPPFWPHELAAEPKEQFDVDGPVVGDLARQHARYRLARAVSWRKAYMSLPNKDADDSPYRLLILLAVTEAQLAALYVAVDQGFTGDQAAAFADVHCDPEGEGLYDLAKQYDLTWDHIRSFPPPSTQAPSDFLQRLRTVNLDRCARWHGRGTEPWSGADWANAMQGEAGEAGNVVKKIRRVETRTGPQTDKDLPELRYELANEIADTLIYLDLLAAHYGIDLEPAVTRKFDFVSAREGFPERLGGHG
jgi:NTP pyrophosphatase (non-canonical NTP hydrolase)